MEIVWVAIQKGFAQVPHLEDGRPGPIATIEKALNQSSGKSLKEMEDQELSLDLPARWRLCLNDYPDVGLRCDIIRGRAASFGTVREVGGEVVLSLGIAVRTAILFDLIVSGLDGSSLSKREQVYEGIQRSLRSGAVPQETKAYLNAILNPRSPRHTNVGEPGPNAFNVIFEACFGPRGLIGRSTRFRNGHDMLTRVFAGPRAIEEFEDAVRGGDGWRQPFLPADPTTLPAFYTAPGDKREQLLDETLAWLKSPALLGPVLFNIHSPYMADGLSACGRAIVERYTCEMRTNVRAPRILYLPVSSRIGAEGGGLRYMTTPHIIATLHRFYHGGLSDVSDKETFSETVHLARMIEEIREAMKTRPGVVLFDGVPVRDPEDPATPGMRVIEQVIADRNVLRTLSRLVLPPVACFSGADDMQAWSHNRFIVMSEWPVSGDDDISRLVPATRRIERDMPPPPDDAGKEILRSMDLTHYDIIIKRYHDQTWREFGDAHYRALDALLTWQDAHGLPFPEPEDTVIHYRKHSASFASLRGVFDAVFAQNPLAGRLVMILSLAPEGLRRSTLHRFVRRSLADGTMVAPLRAFDFEDAATPAEIREDVDVCLDLLLSTLTSIVSDKIPDPTIGIDGVGLDDPDGGGEVGPVRSIGFTTVEALRHARGWAIATFDAECLRFGHRIMADEAFRASSMVLRHTEIENAQSARPWRWHIAGIVDGLKSLHFVEQDGHIALSDTTWPLGSELQGPATADAYFNWLYFFAFSQVLEGRPKFRLSRVFGYESLKAALLDVFDTPSVLGHADLPAGQSVFTVGNPILSSVRGQTQDDETRASALVAHHQASRVGTHLTRLETVGANHAILKGVRAERLTTGREIPRNPEGEGNASLFLSARVNLAILEGTSLALLDDQFDPIMDIDIARWRANLRDAALHEMAQGQSGHAEGQTELDKLLVSLYTFKPQESSARVLQTQSLLLMLTGWHMARTTDLDIVRHDAARTGRDRPDASVQLDLAEAFACFTLGEHLRLAAFAADPTSQFFAVHTGALETFIGCLITMDICSDPNGSRSFRRQARRLIDVFARHIYQYPSERAGLLLLEAQYLDAILVHDANMSKSLYHLAEAERLIHARGRDHAGRLPLYVARLRHWIQFEDRALSENQRTYYDKLIRHELDMIEGALSSVEVIGDRARYWRDLHAILVR